MGGRGLVRAWGPSEELGRGAGGALTRQPGYLDCVTVSVTVLYCELTRQERRGLFSRSRAVHKAGWGWWGEWSVGGKRCTPPALTLSRCTLPGGRGELSRLTCNRGQEPPLA